MREIMDKPRRRSTPRRATLEALAGDALARRRLACRWSTATDGWSGSSPSTIAGARRGAARGVGSASRPARLRGEVDADNGAENGRHRSRRFGRPRRIAGKVDNSMIRRRVSDRPSYKEGSLSALSTFGDGTHRTRVRAVHKRTSLIVVTRLGSGRRQNDHDRAPRGTCLHRNRQGGMPDTVPFSSCCKTDAAETSWWSRSESYRRYLTAGEGLGVQALIEWGAPETGPLAISGPNRSRRSFRRARSAFDALRVASKSMHICRRRHSVGGTQVSFAVVKRLSI